MDSSRTQGRRKGAPWRAGEHHGAPWRAGEAQGRTMESSCIDMRSAKRLWSGMASIITASSTATGPATE